MVIPKGTNCYFKGGTQVEIEQRRERLVQELTECQTRLYAFILTLLPSPESARDVLQETNLVIWRKIDEFDLDREFWPWAAKIARVQVLAYRRDASRDRLIFPAETLDLVAAEAEAVAGDTRRRALVDCLSKLRPEQLEVVKEHYVQGVSVSYIAARMGRTAAAVSMLLHRARQKLAECIKNKLKRVGA